MATKTITPLPASCAQGGVVTGQALLDLLGHAKTNGYAIPAVNVVTSCSINGCLEAAKTNGGPMIIQFSRGGGQFYAGKAANNDNDAACIAGTIAVSSSTGPCTEAASAIGRRRRMRREVVHAGGGGGGGGGA
jgi:fructose-bisphosphate aldolase class II